MSTEAKPLATQLYLGKKSMENGWMTDSQADAAG